MRNRITPLVIGAVAFLLASAVAGQIIFHGQGDTSAISFRYGLLYIVYSGIPWAVRGMYPEVIAVSCQFLFAAIIYYVARRRMGVALIILGCIAAVMCIWILIRAPQLFD
jgi:hypothetical protein